MAWTSAPFAAWPPGQSTTVPASVAEGIAGPVEKTMVRRAFILFWWRSTIDGKQLHAVDALGAEPALDRDGDVVAVPVHAHGPRGGRDEHRAREGGLRRGDALADDLVEPQLDASRRLVEHGAGFGHGGEEDGRRGARRTARRIAGGRAAAVRDERREREA